MKRFLYAISSGSHRAYYRPNLCLSCARLVSSVWSREKRCIILCTDFIAGTGGLVDKSDKLMLLFVSGLKI